MTASDLSGRAAVVTGAARGIGLAVARELAALGAFVAICDKDKAEAERAAETLPSAEAFTADLSDPDAVAAMVDAILVRAGSVDVLVSNAGWDQVGPFLDSDPQVWDRLYAINLRPAFQLTHAFLPGMLERGWGRLVYVASDAGRVGSSGEAVYAACKAGLMGFAKTIARESAAGGVTSNVVCPGPTETQLLEDALVGKDGLRKALLRSIPIGRLGRPEDPAGMVGYLCRLQAEFITGQVISVSGGLTMV